MSKWYAQNGENSDVVISTRIRLARNIEKYPFPSRLDTAGKNEVNELIKKAAFESGPESDFSFIEMKSLSKEQAISLAERHLVSPEFTTCKEGTALIISEDESIGIMLCEEDHIRLQVMKPGLSLEKAFETANNLDTQLDEKLGFAFDERIGYLTSSPTNLGTAMRASVFLHLPALTSCGQIPALANTVAKLGLSLSGVYGNRRQPAGDIYQISNRITLGITEDTAIANLKSIVMQLVNRECSAREREKNSPAVEDKVFRSLGLLENARMITYSEFMELISAVRYGVVLGLVDIPLEKINSLIIEMQPATITAGDDSIDSVTARDAKRAKLIREALTA